MQFTQKINEKEYTYNQTGELVIGPKGADGDSAYTVAVSNGFVGTESEWLDFLQGIDGNSAYQVALENGFEGTESEWLESLRASATTDAGGVLTGQFSNARISESSVTQHEAALTILESQISDLGSYASQASQTAQDALISDNATAIALRLLISDINDTLSSSSTVQPLSANQGRILKGLIDNLNTLVTSDDNTLDELQEIVDYIKINRSDLDALGIASIAGLQAALDAKASQASQDAQDSLISENTAKVTYPTADSNKVANLPLDQSSVNTALQSNIDGKEPLKGVDDNYVTDAEKIVIGNTSNTNTGDQDISGITINATAISTLNGFVDQDVRSGAAPVLDATNFTNLPGGGSVTPTEEPDATFTLPDSGGSFIFSNASGCVISESASPVNGAIWELIQHIEDQVVETDFPINIFAGLTSGLRTSNTQKTIVLQYLGGSFDYYINTGGEQFDLPVATTDSYDLINALSVDNEANSLSGLVVINGGSGDVAGDVTTLYGAEVVSGSGELEGDYAIELTVSDNTQSSFIQFSPTDAVEGDEYTITYTAQAIGAGAIMVLDDIAGSEGGSIQQFTDTMVEYTRVVTKNADATGPRIRFEANIPATPSPNGTKLRLGRLSVIKTA